MNIIVSVSIDVPNLKDAEAFYTNALGCKKIREQGNTMVVLSAGNCDIYLQEKVTGSKPVINSQIVRTYERHWTPIHLDFITKNIDSVVEKVIENGGCYEGGESGEWGSIANCADPFGNGFCVINE